MRTYLIIILGLWFASVLSQETKQSAVEQPLIPAAQPEQAQQDILAAYKKEYAFLTSQVKNIEARIAEFKNQSTQEKEQMNAHILQLENVLLALENQNDQIDKDAFEVQSTAESAEDNRGILQATIQQAESTMSEHLDETQIESLSQFDSDLSKVTQLVFYANETINNSSKISQSTGAFYLLNGTEVTGNIIEVGEIARYGNSSKGVGVLAPAGEGKFKIWKDTNQEAVSRLFNGETSNVLPIFLYESSIKGIEEKQDKTILGVVNSGGLIAWIIIALGLFALVLIILRFWFLKSASASTDKLLNKVVSHIQNKDLSGAIRTATAKKSSSARVLASALRNLENDRDHLEDIISESILHESSQLNRFGSLILVIATVSPLLGLLGTVTGMISTFDIITQYGTGDPALLSGGISVALVTTEVGLAVAIPTLLFGNVLSGWAERIKNDMEKAALRAVNTYQKVIA